MLDLGLPVILVLNMIDVAQGQGLTVDSEKLSTNLGVPVVPIQANKGVGLDHLKEVISRTLASRERQRPESPNGKLRSLTLPARPEFPAAFECETRCLRQCLDSDVPEVLVRRLLLDVGGYMETLLVQRHGPQLAIQLQAARQRLNQAGCPVPAIEARTRYAWIRQATADCVKRPAIRRFSWTDRIDAVLTHRLFGTMIFLAIMFLIFMMLFVAALPLMKIIARHADFLAGLISTNMEPGPLAA